MRPERRALLGALAVVVLPLTGCAAHAAESASAEPWVYAPSIEGAIEDAKNARASDEQIATLEHWLVIRDTPYSDVEQAMQRFFVCLDSVGLGYSVVVPAAGEDYPEAGYRVYDSQTMTPEQSHAVMDSCDKQEFFYVSMAYQLSPGVTERRQREDAEQFPLAIECLAEHGVEVKDVTTLDEVDAYLNDIGVRDDWGCTLAAWDLAG